MTDVVKTNVASIGDEGGRTYEALHTKQIKIVSRRTEVPWGSKYIVVKDVVNFWGWMWAVVEFLVCLLFFRLRFGPGEYSKTFITGGNLIFTYGRREEFAPSFHGRAQMSHILHWLHEKDLRYVVVKSRYTDDEVQSCVRDFNQWLRVDAQVEVMKQRARLRSLNEE